MPNISQRGEYTMESETEISLIEPNVKIGSSR